MTNGRKGSGGGDDGRDEPDPADVLDAIFGGEYEDTDLPRSPYAPSSAALADLDRRIAARLGDAWARWIRETVSTAAKARAAEPAGPWPVVNATTRAELLAELERLRPGLTGTGCARALADDGVLAALVDACGVVDAYQARHGATL